MEKAFLPFVSCPIDWEMTPEDAVAIYLEWGNNWGDHRAIAVKDDESFYFVIDTWEQEPIIRLIRRTFEDVDVLAESTVSYEFLPDIHREYGLIKGVFALPQRMRERLQQVLTASSFGSSSQE